MNFWWSRPVILSKRQHGNPKQIFQIKLHFKKISDLEGFLKSNDKFWGQKYLREGVVVVQFSGLSYSRTQLCNWPVSRFDIGNVICWIGWSIDTYIGTAGTLFVLLCSLFIVISFGARAWGTVWAQLAFLSCYFVVVPLTTLGFELQTNSRLYTSEHCHNHHRSTRKWLSGRYRQSRRARVDVAGDNKIPLPTRSSFLRLLISSQGQS